MSQTFVPIHTRYLNKRFFMNHCRDLINIIDYYGSGNLVYYTYSVNLNRCAEVYNNLIKIDDLTYTTGARC